MHTFIESPTTQIDGRYQQKKGENYQFRKNTCALFKDAGPIWPNYNYTPSVFLSQSNIKIAKFVTYTYCK